MQFIIGNQEELEYLEALWPGAVLRLGQTVETDGYIEDPRRTVGLLTPPRIAHYRWHDFNTDTVRWYPRGEAIPPQIPQPQQNSNSLLSSSLYAQQIMQSAQQELNRADDLLQARTFRNYQVTFPVSPSGLPAGFGSAPRHKVHRAVITPANLPD